ncbi:SAF domain-containing protein [Micromonospora aurantiaca (nom. illeg.)]|uniref:SAF domain-containing protein n=1 Tax=Micromonospora aurantiaca (nom. illeg.) TaxID=47850 RepID=UPI0036577D2A
MTAVAERTQTPARPSISTAQPKRRWSLLVGGLLLVLLSAGVFAVIQLGGDARLQVLAVARPVAAGQPISAADLRTVGVVPDPTIKLVAAGQAQQIVGRTPAVPLAEGVLLTESQLGPASWPDAGQAVVATALKPGQVPAGIAPGSRVLVVMVAKDGGPADPALRSAPVSVPATVVEVVPGADGADTTVVSLLLGRDDATKVAGSGSAVSLVVVGGS